MSNSTIKLQQVCDTLAAKGIPDPRGNASGYGDMLALDLATQVMADIVCERFNWKWNRATATPFYTNSWQQDYPQLTQPNGIIGWGEDCDIVDINNTSSPKPLWNVKWRRGLSRNNTSMWRTGNICWMYNRDLYIGEWPGASVIYSPLITTQAQPQNPLMSMTDKNGNILIVTTFGTTGTVAPFLPAGSAEGLTVEDGSVVWTCVSPTSQGFRIDNLPNATGPTYKVIPYYQIDPIIFTAMKQLLDPMPDSFSRYFYRTLESEWLIASPNPGDLKRGQEAKVAAINSMLAAMKQGDREMNIYALQPATGVVEERWREGRPYTANQPY
jgi:hypothetical protein